MGKEKLIQEQAGKECLALLKESICATGIRVSEVQYLTVEAARDRWTGISLKGKVRTILLPGKLCRKLLKYARRKNQPRKHPFDLGSIFACHFLKSRFWGLFF